jgi:dipeptidyl aminopeptidase/acylaminoacyl peptidase
MMRPLTQAVVVVVLATPIAVAQHRPQPTSAARFDLTIANIMRGPEHYGREPQNVRWSPDGQWIYFNWLPPGTDWREPSKPYRVRAQAGATPERVADADMDRIAPLVANGVYSADRARKLTEVRGDLWLVDMRASTVRRLTETVATESGARFSSDGRRVIFVRDGNAFALDLAGGHTEQLTDIRPGDAGAAPAPAVGGGRGGGRGANPQRTTMEAEQRQLFAVIRDQARADSIRRAEQRDDPDMPKTVILGPGERVQQLSVSPNGAAVLFTTTVPTNDARATIVPNYVTSSGYTEDIAGRTNVGDALATGRMGFQSLPRGDVIWIVPITGEATPPANQAVIDWNASGTTALITATTRSWKTRQLSVVDGATGAVRSVEILRDTAWVGGPCSLGCAGFYDQGRRVYWVSETNGWAQLHTAALDGSDRREPTNLGKWEIYDVALSTDGNSFYFHSSEMSAFDRNFFSMPVNGGTRTQHVLTVGGHQVVLSPDESKMADVYSTNATPPELYLSAFCKAGVACERTQPAQLTLSTSDAFRAGPWKELRIVNIPASDGVPVPAHVITPQELGARPNGAAVIFVHGAGYLHNVHHYWKSYAREYMFHHLLASKGYIVLDIDYRASAGYGRDWRTAIYRWMGGRDLGDQVDGSKWLTKTYGISPERIGIYGGSYGGFMTLMALFTAPKQFGAGAALRSVTDWAHYNHGYTSQILNQPQDDTLAYHRSSPIFFAEGLEDPLVMLHGMVDTNVHFQDIVRLTQRLIELGKTDWYLAPYPVENHGFERPDSWTDEYRRIFELFESTIGPKGSKAKR